MMVEVAVGRVRLKDGRENTVAPDGIGYPECRYYESALYIDGICKHPENLNEYCALSNKPKKSTGFCGLCPFDIHKELRSP
jgi:hypothetical protein